jgi:hypothetical protein
VDDQDLGSQCDVSVAIVAVVIAEADACMLLVHWFMSKVLLTFK